MAAPNAIAATVDREEWGVAAAEERLDVIGSLLAYVSTDVGPPGATFTVRWDGAVGASGAEVTPGTGTISIRPQLATEVGSDLTIQAQDDGDQRVTIPDGFVVLSLSLRDLKDGDLPLASRADLGDRHLVVSLPAPAGGWNPPSFAVPPVPRSGMIPETLTGASFDGGVLTFPAAGVAGPKLLLSVVTGDSPSEFQRTGTMTLGSVSATLGRSPKDLTLLDPDGATVWSFPGSFGPTAPEATVDLASSLQGILAQRVPAGGAEPIEVVYTLRSAEPATASVAFAEPSGALVRRFPGIATAVLHGDPAPPPLAVGEAPFAAEAPTSVVADVTIRYDGLRILAEASDAVPGTGAVSGVIVGPEAVVRALPPVALVGRSPAMAGLIGRAPVDAELSVQLVRQLSGAPGDALGPPGVVQVPAGTVVGTVWVDLPDVGSDPGPVAVAALCTKGRFLWAAAGSGPASALLRLAVRDPDPGGRPVRLGGSELASLSLPAVEVHLPGMAFDPEAFRTTPALLSSDLFVTVDLSDLTLRYAR